VLSKYARFLHPITDRIASDSMLPDRKAIEAQLRAAAASFSAAANSPTCAR